MTTKRANPYNSIFSGGTRPSSMSNGHHPVIWSGRSFQNASVIIKGPADEVRLPQPPSTDVFQNREGGGGMRVGKDFQARIPACIPDKDILVHQEVERSLLVWRPTERIPDADMNGYLKVAKDKFNYSCEQALGLLYWHQYNIPNALKDLGNFAPHPEEWTIEDKILFEQAFQCHGKAFDKIHQMLPDKSISTLIRYYYKWKKTRNKSSTMDRNPKRISPDELEGTPTLGISSLHHNINSNYSLNVISQRQPATLLSDSDEDITKNQNPDLDVCGNCGVPLTESHTKDSLCNTCYLYWKKTGNYRPLTGPLRRGEKQLLGIFRQKRAPPSGMHINHEDLSILASAPPQAENVIVQGIEKDIFDAKQAIQSLKQKVDMLKRKMPAYEVAIRQIRPNLADFVPSNPRVSARWTHEEIMLAAQAVRLHGKNFDKIIQIIPTKSESHLKSFYINYQRRFALEDLMKQHKLDSLHDDLDTVPPML